MLSAWALEHDMDIQDYGAVLDSQITKEFFLNIMKEKAKEQGLFGFEVPLKIHLTSTEMTTENEMLTPTMK